MTDLSKLIVDNAARWATAKITGVGFGTVALRLCDPDARTQYDQLSAKTNVPWYAIAVIHEREASQDWHANIAQGDPWNRVSRHDPTGRGPFTSWQDAGYDALVNCAPHAAKWTDWSTGGLLTLLEQYNGLGYYFKGVPSPYIWSGTNAYKSGKYTRDHYFDPDVVDSQLGCAGLLLSIERICGFTIPLTSPQGATQ